MEVYSMDIAGDLAQYWIAMLFGIAVLGGVGGLFLWALFSGQFDDTEEAALRMLELEDQTEVRS